MQMRRVSLTLRSFPYIFGNWFRFKIVAFAVVIQVTCGKRKSVGSLFNKEKAAGVAFDLQVFALNQLAQQKVFI